MISDWPIVGLILSAGLVTGSYSVTAGVRLARTEPSILGRSHCDACGVQLGFLSTIPVLSYGWQAGRCRACRAAIDPAHIVGELAGGVVTVSAFSVAEPGRAIVLSVLGLALISASTVDQRVLRLPDRLTAVIAVACVGLLLGRPWGAAFTGLGVALISFLTLQLVRRLSGRGRVDPGLGLGDVKLISALALWLGQATPWMIVFAALAGLLAMMWIRPAGGRLPFGPFIAASAWLAGIGGEARWWPTTA